MKEQFLIVIFYTLFIQLGADYSILAPNLPSLQSSLAKECKVLKSGKYKMLSDSDFSMLLEINNQNYKIQRGNNRVSSGKIMWLKACNFELQDCTYSNQIGELEKQLNSLGSLVYSVSNRNKDTIDYVVMRGLHIIADKGILIRISRSK